MPSSCAVRDHLDPGRGRQLALGQHPAHVVVEDLGRGAGNGVQARPRAARVSQSRTDTPALAAAVTISIGENACTCMPGTRALTARTMSAYAVTGSFGSMPPCMQTSVGAGAPGLLGPVGDLLHRQPVGVGVPLPLGERAEPAAHVADVGEVDVAVDHVGDVVADRVPAQRRRRCRHSSSSAGPSAANSASAASSCRGSSSAAGSSAASRSPARTIRVGTRHRRTGCGGSTRARPPPPSRRRRCRSRRAGRRCGPSVSIVACRSVRPPADEPSSGSCHGRPTGRAVLDGQPGRRVGQRGDVRRPAAGRATARRAARTPGRWSAAPAA